MNSSGARLNNIVQVQNSPEQLTLRKAARTTYDQSMHLALLQVALSVGLPVIGAITTAVFSEARPYVAALALAVTVLDVALLDRKHKQILKRAARFSEKFDCIVLEMPWDEFAAGDPPTPEDTHRAAKAASANGLTDWYPEAVAAMPLHIARLVCQRSNLRYDSSLRRAYAAIVLALSFVMVAVLIVYGLVIDMPITALALTVTPATPILSWSWREYFRQKDTADVLDDLMGKAQKVWKEALAGHCAVSECLRCSREFQGAIFTRRSSASSILPWFYKIKRLQLEDEMKAAATDFLKQYSERPMTKG